ncbi:MAG TPA: hypothetical protein ENJ62_05550 [Bryobacterales bacterium]|nr:hypothetical protein [Bryobacterales bacterium]
MKWKALVAAAALLPAAFADRLVLKNGEAFEGDFFGASSQEIRFVIKGKLVFFNAAEVARIEFADGGDVIASEAARAPEVRCPPCPETCPEARAAKPEPEPEKPVVATVRRRAVSEAAEEPEAAAGDTVSGDAPVSSGQVVLPAGTVLTVNLLDVVDLKRDEPGSTYRAVLAAEVPTPGAGGAALDAGAEVLLRLVDSRIEDDVGKGSVALGLVAFQVRSRGRQLELQTGRAERRGRTTKDRVKDGLGKAASTLGRVFGGVVGQQAGGTVEETIDEAWKTASRLEAGTQLFFTLSEPLAIPWLVRPAGEER